MPLVDEHVRAVGQGVRDLAKLHVDLACEEVRDGSKRFVRGAILVGFGILLGTLVVVALGVSLFFLLDQWLSTSLAAAAVAVVFLAAGTAALWLGWRSLGGVSSVTLPRTRAMLWELLTCRDKPTDS